MIYMCVCIITEESSSYRPPCSRYYVTRYRFPV